MSDATPPPARRRFLVNAGTTLLGVIAMAPAAIAALLAVLDPLRQKRSTGGFVRVTSLSAVPENGQPRKFTIVADRHDAWTKTRNVRVGAVYLRRTGPKAVTAINVVCPHAGCFVSHPRGADYFLCPCHNSRFGIDGAILDRKSPSARGLDTLEVEIRDETEVWVKFQNFRAGTHEKIPLS
jgi:menaquinol-cytochrome c reductase iron-sulfur subunit